MESNSLTKLFLLVLESRKKSPFIAGTDGKIVADLAVKEDAKGGWGGDEDEDEDEDEED